MHITKINIRAQWRYSTVYPKNPLSCQDSKEGLLGYIPNCQRIDKNGRNVRKINMGQLGYV